MSEKIFQRTLTKFLRQRSALVFVTIGNAYQQGFPDLYVAHKDWQGWLELKYMKGRIRKEQVHSLKELRRRGVQAYVYRKTADGFSLENEDHTWKQEFASILDTWEWLVGK